MQKSLYLESFDNPVFCENVEYLANSIDDSVITCDEIVNTADSASTHALINVTSTVLTNFHNRKVRYKIDCNILLKVLLVII